jgi:phosphoglycolate phosphatase
MTVFGNTRAVLFDLDGTLLDSAPDLGAAADQMRVARGMPSLPSDVYRPMAGAGARGMLGIAFGVTPDDPNFLDLREEFFTNYARCMTERTRAFDGVGEMIARIVGQGLPWGVVTNKSARFAEPLTRHMTLFSTAATVICGDTTPFAKPHPEPLFEAARRLNVLPAHCMYVGDDARDIVAGLAAGMVSIAASYGYLGKCVDTQTWGAHAEIKNPLDLLQLLPGA